MNNTAPVRLSKILGIGFSVALAFGNTVGVGILRLPGAVAAAVGDSSMIMILWIAGGLYALLGAISVAELASMFPLAGGFYVYARKTFGAAAGFVVGWVDWLSNTVAASYAVMTAADFAAELYHPLAGHNVATALGILAVFTSLHWLGVRIGSTIQNVISATIGALLVGLSVLCFILPGSSAASPSAIATLPLASSVSLSSVGAFAVIAAAVRSVIVSYDGWYGAIYLAEETVDAPRTVPRAIIACTILVTALYVLINAAFLHVLSLPALATSKLPAADAAAVIFHGRGVMVVTVVSLLTVLSLANAVLLAAPRILYAIGRDGLLTGQVTGVSAGGTPRAALAMTSMATAVMVSSGSLDQLIAVAAILYVLNYISAYAAVIVLRIRAPGIHRAFRTLGYPVTTGLVLTGSICFLIAGATDDRNSAGIAATLTLAAVPAYRFVQRLSRTRLHLEN